MTQISIFDLQTVYIKMMGILDSKFSISKCHHKRKKYCEQPHFSDCGAGKEMISMHSVAGLYHVNQ